MDGFGDSLPKNSFAPKFTGTRGMEPGSDQVLSSASLGSRFPAAQNASSKNCFESGGRRTQNVSLFGSGGADFSVETLGSSYPKSNVGLTGTLTPLMLSHQVHNNALGLPFSSFGPSLETLGPDNEHSAQQLLEAEQRRMLARVRRYGLDPPPAEEAPSDMYRTSSQVSMDPPPVHAARPSATLETLDEQFFENGPYNLSGTTGFNSFLYPQRDQVQPNSCESLQISAPNYASKAREALLDYYQNLLSNKNEALLSQSHSDIRELREALLYQRNGNMDLANAITRHNNRTWYSDLSLRDRVLSEDIIHAASPFNFRIPQERATRSQEVLASRSHRNRDWLDRPAGGGYLAGDPSPTSLLFRQRLDSVARLSQDLRVMDGVSLLSELLARSRERSQQQDLPEVKESPIRQASSAERLDGWATPVVQHAEPVTMPTIGDSVAEGEYTTGPAASKIGMNATGSRGDLLSAGNARNGAEQSSQDGFVVPTILTTAPSVTMTPVPAPPASSQTGPWTPEVVFPANLQYNLCHTDQIHSKAKGYYQLGLANVGTVASTPSAPRIPSPPAILSTVATPTSNFSDANSQSAAFSGTFAQSEKRSPEMPPTMTSCTGSLRYQNVSALGGPEQDLYRHDDMDDDRDLFSGHLGAAFFEHASSATLHPPPNINFDNTVVLFQRVDVQLDYTQKLHDVPEIPNAEASLTLDDIGNDCPLPKATDVPEVANSELTGATSPLATDHSETQAAEVNDDSRLASQGHPDHCKPCAFRWTKGCANGDDCQFCHEWHPPRKKKPMKDQKNLMIIARPDGKIEFLRCTIQEALCRS